MNPRIMIVLGSAIAVLAGCSQSGHEKAKAEVLAADKAFCARSVKDGPQAAFLEFVARDAKILNSERVGADAVRDVFMQFPPTSTLTWEPSFVDVSESGDIGYTWGRYIMKVPSPKKGLAPYIRMGTYVTVWKRQADGNWKVVLDGGNPDGQK